MEVACNNLSHGNVSNWRTFSYDKRPCSRYIETNFHLNQHSKLSHMSRKVRKCVHTVRVKTVLLLPKLDYILGLKRIAC